MKRFTRASRRGSAALTGHRPGSPDPQGGCPAGLRRWGANKGSFVQGYNAQIAVDSASQVIVAAEVTQETNDKEQLLPMIALIAANLEQKPEKVSADTGYFSEANVTNEQVKDVDLYAAAGRDKHGVAVETNSDPPPPGALQKEPMREKLRSEAGRAVYKMRKAIVEPVFGQIDE